jgi:formate-dependent nitrite reductase membrane component NrfD
MNGTLASQRVKPRSTGGLNAFVGMVLALIIGFVIDRKLEKSAAFALGGGVLRFFVLMRGEYGVASEPA